MTQLEKLNDEDLHLSAIAAARQDQASTLNTIDHLREIQRRMIHLKRGFSGLQNYAEEALGFSRPAAADRVSAVRLTLAVPDAREKLGTRELTLSSAVAVDRFIRREEHVSERRFTPEEKKQMVEEIAGCSVLETKKALLTFAVNPEAHLLRERVRPVTPTRTELTVFVGDQFLSEVERVRELKGHLSLEQIFTAALEEYLNRIDLVRKKPKITKVVCKKSEHLAAPGVKSESNTIVKKIPQESCINGDRTNQSIRTSDRIDGKKPRTDTRYTLVSDERLLLARSGGQCEFIDEKTGRRCPGRYLVQKDHRIAFALGGPTEFWNLRHYCPAHNRLAAIQTFGIDKMKTFIRTE